MTGLFVNRWAPLFMGSIAGQRLTDTVCAMYFFHAGWEEGKREKTATRPSLILRSVHGTRNSRRNFPGNDTRTFQSGDFIVLRFELKMKAPKDKWWTKLGRKMGRPAGAIFKKVFRLE